MHPRLWLMFASAAFLPRGLALPTLPPRGPVTCGTDTYSYNAEQITVAIQAGFLYLNTQFPQNGYPVQLPSDEGLTLYCGGDAGYYEYPILANHQTYNANTPSPGPDRVVFTRDGEYCAVITETGATSTPSGFVDCENDYPS